MENFIVDKELEFQDEKLSFLLDNLKECFATQQNNFAALCFSIHKIWIYCQDNYFRAKDNEYYNCTKLLAKFGFDKKSISRYTKCYEKFVQGDTFYNVEIKEEFKDFSSSKLFELLPLSKQTIDNAIENKLIRPQMTVKEIREYVKSLKGGTDKTEIVVEDTTTINEEEIPMAYDPTKKYEYSYFETKTKNQLLNMIWELQKAYQKIKNKETTKK